MSLHQSTFAYHKPTESQLDLMTQVRGATAAYAQIIQEILPDGADKDHVLRLVRDAGMWVNVAITRLADGTPR